MINFAVVREENGEILGIGSCPDDDLALQSGSGTLAVVLTDDNVSDLTHYFSGGVFVLKPPKGNDKLNEEALRLLREMRQNELSDTDWTQLPDASLTSSVKTKWQKYRAAMRDLPAAYPDIIDIKEVVFPSKPI